MPQRAGCNLECFIVDTTINKPHHGRLPGRILYSIELKWGLWPHPPLPLPAEPAKDALGRLCSVGVISLAFYDSPSSLGQRQHLRGRAKIGKKGEATRDEQKEKEEDFHGLAEERAENKQIASPEK